MPSCITDHGSDRVGDGVGKSGGVCIATTPEIDANGKAVISSGFEEGATYEVHILYFNDAKYNSDKGEVEKMICK